MGLNKRGETGDGVEAISEGLLSNEYSAIVEKWQKGRKRAYVTFN